MKLSVHEKAVVGSRWSLFAVVAKARFYCVAKLMVCLMRACVVVSSRDARPSTSSVKCFSMRSILQVFDPLSRSCAAHP